MDRRISVGVVGATGVVGQRYLQLLDNHPWFSVQFVAASQQSAGKSLARALEGRWDCARPLSNRLAELPVQTIDAVGAAAETCQLIFSCVDNHLAKEWDARYAEAGLTVIAHASCWRGELDVPVIIPEINPEHLNLLPVQQQLRGWKTGCIVAKPNCSLQSYLLPLWPLHQAFCLQEVLATTMQAVSGAGYPGPNAEELVDNVIPYIPGEEEKSEIEPLKILGRFCEKKIQLNRDIKLSVHCNRVGVTHGHLACVSARFQEKPGLDKIQEVWSQGYTTVASRLPSAPPSVLRYMDEPARPQPALDRDAGNGMTVTIGRLRDCPLMDIRFTALSHNAVRGAAGGGLLLAELLVKQHHFA